MRRILIAFSLMLWSSIMWAEGPSINILLSAPNTQYANMGVYIVSLNTGKVIDAYRESNVIPPASVIKLLTTATMLETVGADFRFSTEILYSGTIQDGVLKGDIWIHGHGDPTLGARDQSFLTTWVKAIRAAGIKSVDGQVIADLSFFDGDALNPGWLYEDAGNYYAPSIFSIAYMNNTLNIQLQSGAVGSLASVIRTVPYIPGLEFENHIRCTQTNEDGAFVHGLPYDMKRYLTGSVPSSRGTFGVQGDIPNPGLLLAQHLTKAMRDQGISVQKEAGYRAEIGKLSTTLIHTHYSAPLSAIVRQTNMKSVNLYAEMMFRYLASNISTPCTIHNADMFIHNYWRNHAVDIESAILKDGCGLAPQDGISPKSLVELLKYMNTASTRDAFYQSLPVSGQSGTLKSLLAGTVLEGKVHAKSGTIGGTKNFAGYIEMPDGDRWAFAIMINSAQGKARAIQPVIANYLLDVYQRNK